MNAQYLGAFRGYPALSYNNKSKLFGVHHDEIFPSNIRVEEIILVWQAGKIASSLVRGELQKAANEDDELRLAVLKRGGKFFVLATMSVILHLRNGDVFLNRLRAEVASSRNTERRLQNYAALAMEWYVDALSELASVKEISNYVRRQEGWLQIKPKILSRWRTFQLAPKFVEEALPKL